MITPSSLPLSHPAEFRPIFGNDGIRPVIGQTRRLNLSSNLHTDFVGSIPLCRCDNCCIPARVYGPTALLLGLK